MAEVVEGSEVEDAVEVEDVAGKGMGKFRQ